MLNTNKIIQYITKSENFLGTERWRCGLVGALGGHIMSSLSEFVSGSGLGCMSGGSEGLLISTALEGSTLMFGLGMLDISFGIPGKAGRLVLGDNFSGSSSDDSSDLSASIAGLLMTGTLKQSEIFTR